MANIKSREFENIERPARSGARSATASEQARACDSADRFVSNRTDPLTRIMESLKDERKCQVRLSKHCKVRFRKNSLWDKKQRNGEIICIKPENYQKLG